MGLVVDNFAGGGGASTGIAWALGRDPDIAINHSPQAIAMHQANHPNTRHLIEDVWSVDPLVECGGQPVDLAWFSPDCFPAGTMILTREGYRPIEQIHVGEDVLTHLRRWRRVTSTMRTRKPLICVRGHGHPGLRVSSEHPFYARQRTDAHGTWSLGPPAWVPAGELGRAVKSYWASPTEAPRADAPEVPVYRGRTLAVTESLLWLAGRYLADGWTRLDDVRADLVLTCGHAKTEALRERVAAWPRAGARCGAEELAWLERDTDTAHQFTTSHRGLVEWLRQHFGHGAGEKRLPGWVFGLSEPLRRAVLDGYVSGDGCVRNGLVECATVSKALAFGLKMLAATLGFVPTVYLRENNGSEIQGRRVNARPAWAVRWRMRLHESRRQTRHEDGMEWAPVREITRAEDDAEVFNLSVEEDESYVAEGVVVHNCTHFSRAKGGKPRSKKTRALAWVVHRWAKAVRPAVIMLENVEEFLTWGPLDENGDPCPRRAGRTFKMWVGKLRGLGYEVQWRSLVAADFGAPTTRKRLFLIARCDGKKIVWPEPTHGRHRPRPWRAAAEVIDFTIPCPSIFGRKRPLSEKTLRRIAAGLRRYVVESSQPFVIHLTHHGDRATHPTGQPLPTVTSANRGELALVAPFIAPVTHTTSGDRTHDVTRPLPVVTTAKGGEFVVVAPFLQAAKTWGGGGNGPRSVEQPMRTITTSKRGEFVVVAPTLVQTGYGERPGQRPRALDVRAPLGTVVSGGKHAVSVALLEEHRVGDAVGHTEASSARSRGPRAVATFVTKFYGTSTGASVRDPLPTVTANGRGGGHLAEVRAFLAKHCDGDAVASPRQRSLFEPARPDAPEGGFGLVTIDGVQYQITDIGMRMLAPKELFGAQSFPADYLLDVPFKGRLLNKTELIELCGNSVAPVMAYALVKANVGQQASTTLAGGAA